MKKLVLIVLSVFVLALLDHSWAQELVENKNRTEASSILEHKKEVWDILPQNALLKLSAFLGDEQTFRNHFDLKLIKEFLKDYPFDPKDYIVELKSKTLQGLYLYAFTQIHTGHMNILKILSKAQNSQEDPATSNEGENQNSQQDRINVEDTSVVSDPIEQKNFAQNNTYTDSTRPSQHAWIHEENKRTESKENSSSTSSNSLTSPGHYENIDGK